MCESTSDSFGLSSWPKVRAANQVQLTLLSTFSPHEDKQICCMGIWSQRNSGSLAVAAPWCRLCPSLDLYSLLMRPEGCCGKRRNTQWALLPFKVLNLDRWDFLSWIQEKPWRCGSMRHSSVNVLVLRSSNASSGAELTAFRFVCCDNRCWWATFTKPDHSLCC